MLISFKFKNVKSFYNENVLSLQRTKDKELLDINTFSVDKSLFSKTDSNDLLKSVIIFGANASGKSNIFKALNYMRFVILNSSTQQIDVIKSNEPFMFYENAIDEESLYEVEIIQNDMYYKYGFTILHGGIKKEWLYRRKQRLTEVYSRIDNKIKISGVKSNKNSFINNTPNTLFLTIGQNFKLDISKYIKDVMDWFNNLLIVFDNNSNLLDIYSQENAKYKNQALEILKQADIGITNMNVIKDKVADIKNPNGVLFFPNNVLGQFKKENDSMYNIDLNTSFNIYDKKNNVVSKKDIRLLRDFGFHSEGTIRLLSYLGWILSALDKGKVILIDEMDSNLHFLVVDYLIKMFNSIDKNPNNAQLICNAHNTLLMDEGLRRDQIYFTSKDEIGVSQLTSLSDYKGVLKKDLYSKKYLAGFYSNLPRIDR
jgi:uncharacterized protein